MIVVQSTTAPVITEALGTTYELIANSAVTVRAMRVGIPTTVNTYKEGFFIYSGLAKPGDYVVRQLDGSAIQTAMSNADFLAKYQLPS